MKSAMTKHNAQFLLNQRNLNFYAKLNCDCRNKQYPLLINCPTTNVEKNIEVATMDCREKKLCNVMIANDFKQP